MKKRVLAVLFMFILVLNSLSGCWAVKVDERSAEEVLYDGITRFEQQISDVYRFSAEELDTAYKNVLYAHPEIFWIWESYTIYTLESGMVTGFSPELTMDLAQVSARKAEFDSLTEHICAQASEFNSDYEKTLYLHDYLVNTVSYDEIAATEIDKESYDLSLRESTTAYGAIVNNKAICTGYSKAFQYLLGLCGVAAICVGGDGISEDGTEPHLWNIVCMDGEYYHIDVTWDDPVMESEQVRDPSYTYFGLTTQEILLDHTIDPEQDLPLCTAETYNYFKYNGQYLAVYDFAAVKEIVERAYSSGKDFVDIRFSDAAQLRLAEAALYTDGQILDIPCINESDDEYVYYNTSDVNILTIYL